MCLILGVSGVPVKSTTLRLLRGHNYEIQDIPKCLVLDSIDLHVRARVIVETRKIPA